MTQLPILYSRTAKGQIQQWQIEVEGGKFRTIEGIQGGTLTTSEWTVCKGKNPGKKNETTPEMQAGKEAAAKHQKKIDKGYFVNIDDIDNETFFEPMLAKSYDDAKDEVRDCIENGKPIYCQPKLDGARCCVGMNYAKTRNGKDYFTIGHIIEAVTELLTILPDGFRFDGELYNHAFKEDFNRIISLVKKSKPTEEDIKESAKYIEYWIYDCSISGNFSERNEFLNKNLKKVAEKYPFIKIVPTQKVKSIKELDSLFSNYLADGFEGQMIRHDAPYENKRSWNLLKRKEFITEEFTILDIIEGDGNKTGMAASIAFKTKEGKAFNSNVKGSFEFARDLLENKAKYIGEQGTVRFFNYTPDKIPRFPYLIAIRNYE